MSLLVINQPKIQKAETAGELEPGTWFLDLEGQISTVLIDDRTHEKRVISFSYACSPFIASNPVRNFKVSHVLPTGTILQIVQSGGLGK